MFFGTIKYKSNFFISTAMLLCILFLLVIPGAINARIIINSSLAQEYHAVPGEIYSGQFVIKNPDEKKVEVKIYQTDYRFYSNGDNFYDEPGSHKRSNATWIKFSPQIFSMEGKSERAVNYTVTIPSQNQSSDIELSGTFWSLLMIESLLVDEMEKNIAKNQVGITSVMRYAMQIITHLGTKQNKNLLFSGSKLLKHEQNLYLQFDIENTGDQLLKPHVRLELYNNSGLHIGNFLTEQKRTFPGTSVRHGIKLENVQTGAYKALIIADCGEDDLFGHQLELDIK